MAKSAQKSRHIPDEDLEIIPPKKGHRFQKGQRVPGSGRKKGSLNKIPMNIKKMVESALFKLGGDDYLVGLSKTHPDLFIGLVKAIIPLQVRAAITVPTGPLLMSKEEAAEQLRARGIPVPSFLDDGRMITVSKRKAVEREPDEDEEV